MLYSNLDNKISKRGLGEFTNIELYGTPPFIDFHHNNSESDHTSRIAEYSNGRLTIEAPNGINISSNTELQVNGTGVSLSSHNHNTIYPRTQSGHTNVRALYGTKVITGISTQYSQQLFSFNELKDLFGVSSCNMANTACFVSNGDWNANNCQMTSFSIPNGWHVGFSTNISGLVRVNYLVLYFA